MIKATQIGVNLTEQDIGAFQCSICPGLGSFVTILSDPLLPSCHLINCVLHRESFMLKVIALMFHLTSSWISSRHTEKGEGGRIDYPCPSVVFSLVRRQSTLWKLITSYIMPLSALVSSPSEFCLNSSLTCPLFQ